MKTLISLLVLGGFLFAGCEEDPIIQVPGFRTQPVIYGVIDTDDTVHTIRVTRFFSGMQAPAITSKSADSIYFSDADVHVTLRTYRGTHVEVPVEFVRVPDKDSGTFNAENYGVYRFRNKMVTGQHTERILSFDMVYAEVRLPGLEAARCSTSVVRPPTIWWPLDVSMYIYIVPDNPMRVLWSGDAWNEIDVSFQIHEMYQDSIKTLTFHIQKTNDVHFNGKYYEIKVPYELLTDIINKNLKVRNDIIRRYFGEFRIDIHTGNKDFDNYMRFRDGINDFNYNPFSNVANGMGMIAGKSSTFKEKMHLDQATRLYFASDPNLKKFRFIEY